MKKIILAVMVSMVLVGCSSTKVNSEKVHLFAEDVTRSQTITGADKATVANVKHILKIENEKLDGKLYRLISKEYKA